MAHVKRLIPLSARIYLRRTQQRFVVPFFKYVGYRAVLLPHAVRSKTVVNPSEIKNLLQNSGGVPLAREFVSARQVVEGLRGRGAVQRNQGIEGFEGFSPDDAVFSVRRISTVSP